MSGYIALYRDAFDHPMLEDADRFRAWFWLVANAAWKPTTARIKGETVELERGELSFSQRFLAEKWSMSKSRVDRFLADLRREGMIETRTKNGASDDHKAGQGQSIIKICNYDKYQQSDDTERGNSGATSGATAGQQRGKEEEGNKGRKESPLKPPKGQGKVGLPADWTAPAVADLPPQAKQCAGQWPEGAYARHAEAFHSYWRSNGKKMTDWRLTWANRVIAIHDDVMRRHQMANRFGSPEPSSSSPMVERILRERQHQ